MIRWCFALTLGSATMAAAQTPPAPYRDAIAALSEFVRREVADKKLPAMSVAIVDGRETIWSAGFGVADAKTGAPATAATAYRAGSVSKLFTDLAAVQLVERGELSLDTPVETYLPDFRPASRFTEK